MKAVLCAFHGPRHRWLIAILLLFKLGAALSVVHWFGERQSRLETPVSTAIESCIPKLTIMVDSYSPEFDREKQLIHGTTPTIRILLDGIWSRYLKRYAAAPRLQRLWDITDYPMASIHYQAGDVDVELTSVHPLFMMRDSGPAISSGPVVVTPELKDGGKSTMKRDRRDHSEYYVYRDEFDEILAMTGVTLQTFRDAYGLGLMPA